MNQKFSLSEFRQQFPFYQAATAAKIIYFDNAATTQKPQQVLTRANHFYATSNANVHRGSHQLSREATTQFEAARSQIKRFINAKSDDCIVWTKGTTEAINLVAQGVPESWLQPGDEIVVSIAEHHANFVPWQQLAKRKQARLTILPIDQGGRIIPGQWQATKRTKIVAISHLSNVTGKLNDVSWFINQAKKVGALSLIDGAQAIAHLPVDVSQLDCDFYVFSGHKLYAPNGIGVLYGKADWLAQLAPMQYGGEMIAEVTETETTFAPLPFRLEAGTPNVAGAIALAEAIEFVQHWQSKGLLAYEMELRDILWQKLAEISGIQLIVADKPDIPLFSFVLHQHHSADLANYLDAEGIAVRAGHLCAMPLLKRLNQPGVVRVSLAPYNSQQEIDQLIEKIRKFSQPHVNASPSFDLPAQATTLNQLKNAKGWQQKQRLLMQLGSQLQRLPATECRAENKIMGCESDVWLICHWENDRVCVAGDSNSRLVRGLLHVMFSLLNGITRQQASKIDLTSELTQMGLFAQLSPSRGNGVLAVIDRITQLLSVNDSRK